MQACFFCIHEYKINILQEPSRDVFRITEYARRCIPLIREDPNQEEFINCLIEAAESSAAIGAHEVSKTYGSSAALSPE